MTTDQIAVLKAAAELAEKVDVVTDEKCLEAINAFWKLASPASIRALIARLESAEKDSERIDWMEATPEHYLRKSKRHWYCTLRQETASGYSTMREAIDAKMEDGKC